MCAKLMQVWGGTVLHVLRFISLSKVGPHLGRFVEVWQGMWVGPCKCERCACVEHAQILSHTATASCCRYASAPPPPPYWLPFAVEHFSLPATLPSDPAPVASSHATNVLNPPLTDPPPKTYTPFHCPPTPTPTYISPPFTSHIPPHISTAYQILYLSAPFYSINMLLHPPPTPGIPQFLTPCHPHARSYTYEHLPTAAMCRFPFPSATAPQHTPLLTARHSPTHTPSRHLPPPCQILYLSASSHSINVLVKNFLGGVVVAYILLLIYFFAVIVNLFGCMLVSDRGMQGRGREG